MCANFDRHWARGVAPGSISAGGAKKWSKTWEIQFFKKENRTRTRAQAYNILPHSRPPSGANAAFFWSSRPRDGRAGPVLAKQMLEKIVFENFRTKFKSFSDPVRPPQTRPGPARPYQTLPDPIRPAKPCQILPDVLDPA